MTLEQLRYFVTLGQWEHVGHAARAAGVSPSALSTAVSQLETELGFRLFDRIGRNIRLNPKGRGLMPKASAILSQVRSIGDDGAKSIDLGFQGVLRLGASPFLATAVLAPLWGAFHRKNPGSVLELTAPGSGETVARLLRGELDAALLFSPQSHPGLRIEEASEGELLPVASVTHPIFKKPASRRFEALGEFPFIAHHGVPGIELCEEHPELRRNGLIVRSAAKFSDDSQAVAFMVGSTAWSLLPQPVIHFYSNKIRAVTPPRSWRARYRICWVQRTSHEPSAGLRRLMNITNARLVSDA